MIQKLTLTVANVKLITLRNQ